MTKRMFLFLAVIVGFFAHDGKSQQNCIIQDYATNASGRSVILDNRTNKCTQWRLAYYSEGFGAVSVELDGAPDSNAAPGTWTAITTAGACTVTGSNPATSTASTTVTFSGCYFPWISVNATLTGSGTMGAGVRGAGGISASTSSGGGGSGNVNAAGTLTANKAVIGSGGTNVGISLVNIDGSGNVATPGSVSTGDGTTTGAIDLIGKTSLNTLTITVPDTTAAGSATMFPGTVPVVSGVITSGHCTSWLDDHTIQDAGAACGGGGGGSVGPSANAHNSTSQSIGNNVDTALTFDTNDWNTAAIHSTVTNPTRFTATSTGYWQATCQVGYGAAPATGAMYLDFHVNGSTPTVQAVQGGYVPNFSYANVTQIIKLTSGDYVECITKTTGGSSTALSGAWMQLTLLSTTF